MYEIPPLLFWLTFGLWIVIGLLMIHYFIRAKFAEEERRKLNTLFGTFWTPEAAWAVLRGLAQEFHKAAERQVELQKSGSSEINADTLVFELQSAAARLQESKTKFWDAYALAKNNWDTDWHEIPTSYKAFLEDQVTN